MSAGNEVRGVPPIDVVAFVRLAGTFHLALDRKFGALRATYERPEIFDWVYTFFFVQHNDINEYVKIVQNGQLHFVKVPANPFDRDDQVQKAIVDLYLPMGQYLILKRNIESTTERLKFLSDLCPCSKPAIGICQKCNNYKFCANCTHTC